MESVFLSMKGENQNGNKLNDPSYCKVKFVNVQTIDNFAFVLQFELSSLALTEIQWLNFPNSDLSLRTIPL